MKTLKLKVFTKKLFVKDLIYQYFLKFYEGLKQRV